MQMVSEVMTRDIRFVSPQESLQRAAQMMDELNVGALPVCEGERLVGMVTDRDITVRATAAGMAPAQTHVDEVMSTDVRWCFEDQSVDDVMRQMADTQIRRVPVVSHDDAHKLVGIVSLGDLATKTAGGTQKQDVERTMEKVSSPSEPDLSPQRGTAYSAPAGAPAAGSDTGTATGLAGSDVLAARVGVAEIAGGGATGAADTDMSPTSGAAGDSAPAGAARMGGQADATRDSGAPGGTDAAGASGASAAAGGLADKGGTGGTAGATAKGGASDKGYKH